MTSRVKKDTVSRHF